MFVCRLSQCLVCCGWLAVLFGANFPRLAYNPVFSIGLKHLIFTPMFTVTSYHEDGRIVQNCCNLEPLVHSCETVKEATGLAKYWANLTKRGFVVVDNGQSRILFGETWTPKAVAMQKENSVSYPTSVWV